jgi:hypothetical protein
MVKSGSAAVILCAMAIAVPASAQTYYVAVNNKTGRCQVTDKVPDGTKTTQVTSDTYTTKKDASAAMKAVCTK